MYLEDRDNMECIASSRSKQRTQVTGVSTSNIVACASTIAVNFPVATPRSAAAHTSRTDIFPLAPMSSHLAVISSAAGERLNSTTPTYEYLQTYVSTNIRNDLV